MTAIHIFVKISIHKTSVYMNILLYALCSLGVVGSLAASPEILPKIKWVDEYGWPPVYREIEDSEYRVSASGQFSKQGFEYLNRDNLVVIDLRREFHGFVDGYPISWKVNGSSYDYNDDLTADEIEKGESLLLNEMTGFKTIQTERELVEGAGARYVRFPIADHSFPQGEEVDRLIELVRSFGKDTQIHFHCAGGGGRTTTFLTMIEMMRNSQRLSADEIFRSQEALGGINLYEPELRYADEPDRIEGAVERYQFLQSFYQYCLENPDFSQSWSSWK